MTSKLIDVQEITRINISIRNMWSNFTRSVYLIIVFEDANILGIRWSHNEKIEFRSWKVFEYDDFISKINCLSLISVICCFTVGFLLPHRILTWPTVLYAYILFDSCTNYSTLNLHIVKRITSQMDVDQYLWTSWKIFCERQEVRN